MAQCSACGETNLPEEARFCGQCGRLLSDAAQYDRPTMVGMEMSGALPLEDTIGAQTVVGSLPPGCLDQPAFVEGEPIA